MIQINLLYQFYHNYNQEDILKNLIPKKPNFLPIYEVRKYPNIQFIDTFVCKTGTKVEIKNTWETKLKSNNNNLLLMYPFNTVVVKTY